MQIIYTTEERHEKSHIKKFPDPDGQESLFHVCSSALIANLFVLFQLYLTGAITHILSKSTKNFGYWRKYEKNLIENSSKVAGILDMKCSGKRKKGNLKKKGYGENVKPAKKVCCNRVAKPV